MFLQRTETVKLESMEWYQIENKRFVSKKYHKKQKVRRSHNKY